MLRTFWDVSGETGGRPVSRSLGCRAGPEDGATVHRGRDGDEAVENPNQGKVGSWLPVLAYVEGKDGGRAAGRAGGSWIGMLVWTSWIQVS